MVGKVGFLSEISLKKFIHKQSGRSLKNNQFIFNEKATISVFILHTVCSVALACSSHSSTSPPGLIFTQTHSWAQPCPAHWQYCDAKTQLSQHIDWQQYCTMADKEQNMSQEIAGYKLTAARAPQKKLLFPTISSLFGHSKPFPAS